MRRAVVSCLVVALIIAPIISFAANNRLGVRPDKKTPYLVTADDVQFDDELGLVIAKGHVEISQNDQVLLADVVTYNQRTDTATASGHVSLLQPSGDIMFADFAELQDDFKNGFVRNIRMLLSVRSRMAGNTGRRINGTRTEIRRGVYSPCDLCAEDPTRAPLWQIRGDRVVDDQQLQIVEYRDAVMEIDGIPVLWTPYFSHPDPSVKRASGFLAPSLGYSSLLGFHTDIPYYWVISPDKDMTFAPLFTTDAGIVLADQYRQRFADGFINLDGSIGFGTPRVDIGPGGAVETAGDIRGHFFGTGEYDFDPNWRAIFNVERESDQTYLLRYNELTNLYNIPTPQNFLNSFVTLENFQRNSYLNVTGWSFQSLRPGVGDSVEPFAAPSADYLWVSDPDRLGGQLSAYGSFLNLMRITGIDERRLSVGSAWQKPFDGAVGDRFNFTMSLRGDGYASDNLPVTTATSPNGTQSAVAGRIFPQAALTWRYPWVRRGDKYSAVIEPIVMAAAAPLGGNPGTIPNEDSQDFEFDDSDLFVPDRFPGFDRVDSGQRVDYGFRGGLYADRGGSLGFLVGQSYAFQKDDNFLPASGLGTKLSDVVGRVTIAPFDALNFIYRYRLGHDDLALRSQEVTTQFGPPSLRFSVSYIQIEPSADIIAPVERKEVQATLSAEITRNWSVDMQELRDFSNGGVNLLTLVGVTYRDECLAVTTSIGQSGIEIGDIRPGLTVLVTFVFKNLGEFGVHAASFNEP